jgi:hypothetical protein
MSTPVSDLQERIRYVVKGRPRKDIPLAQLRAEWEQAEKNLSVISEVFEMAHHQMKEAELACLEAHRIYVNAVRTNQPTKELWVAYEAAMKSYTTAEKLNDSYSGSLSVALDRRDDAFEALHD